jgi:hypothetical protein
MKILKRLSRAELKVLTGGISPYIVKCCKDRTCPTNPYCLRVLTPVLKNCRRNFAEKAIHKLKKLRSIWCFSTF